MPWCIKKCPYCDFNSHAGNEDLPEKQYIQTLLKDLEQDLSRFELKSDVNSIFFGGGTPSLFQAESYDRLLEQINSLIPFSADIEITLEANPGSFEYHKFAGFKKAGINRLSIGIQSFNDGHLQALGRVHNAEEANTAIIIAQDAGFENINLDLMFALPKQNNEEMQQDIETAIHYQPAHISHYQLTIEPNTYFHRFPPKQPDSDVIQNSLEQCQNLLKQAGFHQYEISAYAQANQQCQHNLNYWQFGDYLGIGAGAHGKIKVRQQILRSLKQKHPVRYLEDNSAKIHTVSKQELPLEFLMNQLRLKKGFSLNQYQNMTGLDSESLEPGLSQCIDMGLLSRNNNWIKTTERGWLFVDEILTYFIA